MRTRCRRTSKTRGYYGSDGVIRGGVSGRIPASRGGELLFMRRWMGACGASHAVLPAYETFVGGAVACAYGGFRRRSLPRSASLSPYVRPRPRPVRGSLRGGAVWRHSPCMPRCTVRRLRLSGDMSRELRHRCFPCPIVSLPRRLPRAYSPCGRWCCGALRVRFWLRPTCVRCTL